jgi:glycerol kinase
MYVLTIDQGTTGTTTALFDKKANLVRKTNKPIRQIYPQPGWVEHDPLEIWQTVKDTVDEILNGFSGDIVGIGITNQRETTIIWDKTNGQPIYNAIVWQCRRTAQICDQLRRNEYLIRMRTGLPLDPYFSGTKIKWLLENASNYRIGNLIFGTVDTWLIWKLTGGKVHATDFTNASRTMLLNIRDMNWDDDLLKLLNIPASIMPELKNSADEFGTVESIPSLKGIPLLGVAGDQQAALFGQKCFEKGQIKNTYGTGCFLVMNTGSELVQSEHGLITTLGINAACLPCYALEGSVFIAGAAVQWLRDELNIIDDAAESETCANAVTDNNGVYFVPAFVGLGAPHWNAQARGTIVGLTRGSNRNHLIRAVLESLAYQTYDVFSVMEKEVNVKIDRLAVDGGATVNSFLMQFQSDILNVEILKPEMAEITSVGAAYLAGLKAGLWKDSQELLSLVRDEKVFYPRMNEKQRQILLTGWQHALRQTLAR